MFHRCILILFLLAALAACGQPAPAATSGTAGNLEAGVLVAVQGQTSLKRAGWRDYAPAAFGTTVRRGDLLRVGDTGRAIVVCEDLALAEVASGVSGLPCKTAASQVSLIYAGGLAIPTRGDPATGDFPVVGAPRKTRLLNPRPMLRWTDVPGATAYRVSIQGAEWQTEVKGVTELPYPADAPELKPGISYKLVVSTGVRASTEEPGAGLGFEVLDATEAATIRTAEARIRALALDDAGIRLLIANLYAAHALYAEAIDLVTEAAGQPALARLLGDLYLAVGLNRPAEEAYLQALTLASQTDDPEGQAAAHRMLARIYDVLGNPGEAGRHAEQAIAFYDKLGDTAIVTELRALLTP